MTDDLMQFLRDRLDEDERTARAATQGDWVWSREFVTPPGYHHRTIGPLEPGDAAYIARHDPARILREVEAKRKIVDASAARCPVGCRVEHSFSGSCMLRSLGPAWEADGGRWVHGENGEPIRPPHTTEWTLRLLALPYANHPDYRQEWKP